MSRTKNNFLRQSQGMKSVLSAMRNTIKYTLMKKTFVDTNIFLKKFSNRYDDFVVIFVFILFLNFIYITFAQYITK